MKKSKFNRSIKCIALPIVLIVYFLSGYIFVSKLYDNRKQKRSTTPLQFIDNLWIGKNLKALKNSTFKNLSFKNETEFKNESSRSPNLEEPNNMNKTEFEHKRKRKLFLEMADINKTVKNIFFVESRCSTEKMLKGYADNKGLVLTARQSCAVESTAVTNPDRTVFVFHSCPLEDDFLHHSPQYVVRLFSYPNVHVVRLNNSLVFDGSPVQRLFEDRLLENSSFPVEHSSDIIRLVLLWRFGGTYCDLDVVTIRSLEGLRSNWAGAEDEESVATGVMNFDHQGAAHDMLQRMLEHINQHYDRNGWTSNGPWLMTTFVIRECNISQVREAESHCLLDFTVYKSYILYPIHYSQVHQLFVPHLGSQTARNVKTSSYSVHMWNKISHDMPVFVGSTQGYALLADQFCPNVYRSCGTLF
uniref:Alpha 1,4-glycosyltransferase domain-containing protein n=1 Tax=Graphocephala atropunctata TaxID=36148 RepID=A0A1B6M2G1_9HEMI